jgi:hypothetical protein
MKSIDQKNHHKIPLNPPLPVCDRKKITKGGTPISSLWQREVGRDFTRKFQTAKLKLQNLFPFKTFSSSVDSEVPVLEGA